MKQRLTNKQAVQQFYQELKECDILNIDFSLKDTLELAVPSSSLFFDEFFLGKKYKVVNLFSHEIVDTDGKIGINGTRIIRKEIYTKEELMPFITPESVKSDELVSTRLPIIQNQILSSFASSSHLFLSFGNLYYQRKANKKINIAPLVFFKTSIKCAGDVYYLSLDYNSPLFNLPLFNILKSEYGIDLSPDMSSFDYDTYLAIAKEKISKYLFALDDSIYLVDREIVKWNSLQVMTESEPMINADPIFRSLEEDMVTTPQQNYVSKHEYPSYIQNGLNSLSAHPCLEMASLEPLSTSFIQAAIDETILHKRNVLIVSKNKADDEEIRKTLVKDYYDAFMPYKDITKPGTAIFTLLEAVANHPTYVIDANAMMHKEEMQQTLDRIELENNKLYALEIASQEDGLTLYDHYLSYYKKANEIYDFSRFGNYSYDMYTADKDFLTYLDSYHAFEKAKLSSHPFYGLSLGIKSEDYVHISSFLNKMKADVLNLADAIEKSKIKLSAWSAFQTIKDFDDSVSHFDILDLYDGFSLSYFDIVFTREMLDHLDDLKECYRLKASIKLSIDIVCQKKIWDLNFDSLLADVRSSLIKENKRYHEVRELIKIKANRRNFKSLIVLIYKFQENKAKIAGIIPLLSQTFGEAINNIDGIVTIQKAYSFVDAYNSHIKANSKLNFVNPFTDLIFHDSAFLELFKNTYYPRLKEARSQIKSDVSQYQVYFFSDQSDFLSLSLSDILAMLQTKLSASEEDFKSYLLFQVKAAASSDQLRSVISKIDEQGKNMSGFADNYLASIYQYMLKKAMKDGDGVKTVEERSADTFEMYRRLQSDGDMLRLDILKSFETIRRLLISSPSYLQTISNLKNRYHYQRMYSPKEALRIAGDELYHLYPLETTYLDKCDYLRNSKFDLVIVILKDDDSLIDLYTALSLGKKALVLSSSAQFEKIPELTFSLNDDLTNYKETKGKSDVFLKVLDSAMGRQGIKLLKDYKTEDGTIVPYYFEKNNEKFALRIINTESDRSSRYYYLMASSLFFNYQIKTVALYTIPFIVYEDLCVMSLYKDVKSVLSEDKVHQTLIGKLSYEQQQKIKYFQMLDSIGNAFPDYLKSHEEPTSLDNAYLTKSKMEIRPIVNVSYLEVANGILTYLSNFTYLSRDTLIKRIAGVLGTDDKNIDFRLLFARAENLLIKESKIKASGMRLYLIRK